MNDSVMAFRRTLRALFLLVFFASNASALTIEELTLSLSPFRSDSFVLTLKAEESEISSQEIAFTVYTFSASIPSGGLTGKPGARLFQYRSPHIKATFYKKKGRLVIQGSGLPLSALSNPLSVSVTAGASGACGIVTLKERTVGGKRKGSAKKKGKRVSGKRKATSLKSSAIGSCSIISARAVDPTGISSDQSADVEFEAKSDPGTPEISGLGVYRSQGGRPTGAPICPLNYEGAGIYRCTGNVAVERTDINLIVSGGGTLSPGFQIKVIAALGDKEIAKIVERSTSLGNIVDSAIERSGNTEDSRRDLVLRLRREKGVSEVELSENGYDITVTYDSGLSEGILLSPQGELPDLNSASKTFQDSNVSVNAGGSPGGGVFIWDTGYFPGYSVAPTLLRLFEKSKRPEFQNRAFYQYADATVDALKTMRQYGTIVLVSHGGLFKEGAGIFGQEEPTALFMATHLVDFAARRLMRGKLGSQRKVIVMPSFIEKHAKGLPSSIVHVDACYSANPYSSALSDAFRGNGAASFVGYSFEVFVDKARDAALELFCGMLLSGKNLGDSYSEVKAEPTMILEGSWQTVYAESEPLEVKISPEKKLVGVNAEFQMMPDLGPQTNLTECYKPEWKNKEQSIGSITATTDHAPVTYKAVGKGTDTVELKLLRPTDKSEIGKGETTVTVLDSETDDEWIGSASVESTSCVFGTSGEPHSGPVFGYIIISQTLKPEGNNIVLQNVVGDSNFPNVPTSGLLNSNGSFIINYPFGPSIPNLQCDVGYQFLFDCSGTVKYEFQPVLISNGIPISGDVTYTVTINNCARDLGQGTPVFKSFPCTGIFKGQIIGPPPAFPTPTS